MNPEYSLAQYPFLARRVFNTPLLIHPQKAEVIANIIAEGQALSIVGDPIAKKKKEDDRPPYQVIGGKLAKISVQGTLVHKSSYLDAMSGMTGYNVIQEQFIHAVNNPDMTGIILDIDSPGGEVSGCFDLVDLIYDCRDAKPIVAALNENAYSAAYAIASAAHRITAPRTGGVGSIGVICLHVDYSKAIEKGGAKVTMIKYGDHKGEGAQHEPLSDWAMDKMQGDIDYMGELFVDTVARNRELTTRKVKNTQAATFLAQEGVDIGLADAVMSQDMEIINLLDTIT